MQKRVTYSHVRTVSKYVCASHLIVSGRLNSTVTAVLLLLLTICHFYRLTVLQNAENLLLPMNATMRYGDNDDKAHVLNIKRATQREKNQLKRYKKKHRMRRRQRARE